MAFITRFFHYSDKNTIIHSLDPRVKILFLIVFGITSGFLNIPGLIVLACSIFLVGWISKAALKEYTKSFLLLLPLLTVIILLPSIPGGHSESITEVLVFQVDVEGMLRGTEIAFRLFVLFLAGHTYTTITLTKDTAAVITWALKPVPLLPEREVGFIAGLTLRMLPTVFDSYQKLTDARRARGSEYRPQPMRFFLYGILPFLILLFRKADNLSEAVSARNLDLSKTQPFTPKGNGKEAPAIIILFCTVLAAFSIDLLARL
ncbi:MAG: energy-coupling factor transporter transmembrane component T family protein [Spirochaetia bacterium]